MGGGGGAVFISVHSLLFMCNADGAWFVEIPIWFSIHTQNKFGTKRESKLRIHSENASIWWKATATCAKMLLVSVQRSRSKSVSKIEVIFLLFKPLRFVFYLHNKLLIWLDIRLFFCKVTRWSHSLQKVYNILKLLPGLAYSNNSLFLFFLTLQSW